MKRHSLRLPLKRHSFLKGNQDKIKGNSGAIFDNINKNQIEDLLIPLPTIEVQEEIVRELEQYQKIIDGAKQVVDNYKPVIDIDPSWEMKELGDICEIKSGGTPSKDKVEYWLLDAYMLG